MWPEKKQVITVRIEEPRQVYRPNLIQFANTPAMRKYKIKRFWKDRVEEMKDPKFIMLCCGLVFGFFFLIVSAEAKPIKKPSCFNPTQCVFEISQKLDDTHLVLINNTGAPVCGEQVILHGSKNKIGRYNAGTYFFDEIREAGFKIVKKTNGFNTTLKMYELCK